jgi:hypothetical protein
LLKTERKGNPIPSTDSPHQNSSKHEKSSILHGSTMNVNMTPYLKVEFTVLVRVAAGIRLINQKKKIGYIMV